MAKRPDEQRLELLQGTLDMLVLRTLQWGPQHGHGIGQTIHEEPYITETRTVVLEPNITCTMEPLYMIPGRMGFHVEDMYRITPTGFEALTGAITPNDELIRIG